MAGEVRPTDARIGPTGSARSRDARASRKTSDGG